MQKIDTWQKNFYFHGFFGKTPAAIDKTAQKGYTRLKCEKKGNDYGKDGNHIAGAENKSGAFAG